MTLGKIKKEDSFFLCFSGYGHTVLGLFWTIMFIFFSVSLCTSMIVLFILFFKLVYHSLSCCHIFSLKYVYLSYFNFLLFCVCYVCILLCIIHLANSRKLANLHKTSLLLDLFKCYLFMVMLCGNVYFYNCFDVYCFYCSWSSCNRAVSLYTVLSNFSVYINASKCRFLFQAPPIYPECTCVGVWTTLV